MARTLPPMMQVMKDIGGVEFPERFVNLDGATARRRKRSRRSMDTSIRMR